MKLFYRHLFKTLYGPIILGVLGSTFIFLVDILSEIVQSVIIKGIPLLSILEILSYDIIHILPLSIPMGVMLGSILGYDILARDNELIAFKSLGIGMRSILFPPLVVGIFFSSTLILINQFLNPIAKSRRESLVQEIAYKHPTFRLENDSFMSGLKNYSIYVKKTTPMGKNKFIVFQNKSDNFSDIILGEGLRGIKGALVLENAIIYEMDEMGKKNASANFERQSIPLKEIISNFGTLENWPNDYLISLSDLARKIDLFEKREYPTLRLRSTFHWRVALSISPIILALLAALITSGSHRRFRRGDNIVLGIAFLFFYWLLMTMGKSVTNDGLLKPHLVLWAPNIAYSILAFVLYLKRERI